MVKTKIIAALALPLMLSATFAAAASHDTLGRPAGGTTPTVVPGPTWQGTYYGLGAGSSSDSDFTITSGEGDFVSLADTSSFSGFAGFLRQTGPFVYGVELAIGRFSDMSG